MVLSLVFLLATLFVYAYFKELRTVADKSFLCFISALTVTYAAFPYRTFYDWSDFASQYSMWLFFVGFSCAFLWLNVLIFDIWWTFR